MNAVATYVHIVINRHIGGYRMAAIISFSEARNRLRPAAVPQMKPQTQTRPADAANLEDQIADAGMLLLVRLGGLTMTDPSRHGGVSSHSSDDRSGTVLKPARLADIERELAAAGVPREAADIAAKALGVRRNADGKTISLPDDWWKRFDDQDERLGKLYLASIGMGRPRPELE